MLIVIVLIFGNLFLKLHTLPERLAHALYFSPPPLTNP
jgi:hypothetical protein